MKTLLVSQDFREQILHRLIHSDEYYCAQCGDWFGHAGSYDHCPNCGEDYDPGKQASDDPVCPNCGEKDWETTCPNCGVSGGNGGLDCSECWASLIEHSWFPEEEPSGNVILGASASDQTTFDAAMPHLVELSERGWRTCVSLEPLLAPVKLPAALFLDWVIVGGETGPGARPMHPEWVRALRDECIHARVPFFFKRWAGGRNKGRTLDLRTWDEMPEGFTV